MFIIYQKLKWIYQKFNLSYWTPFIALISYTLLGAFIFKTLEQGTDDEKRNSFKNETEYAYNQVFERMLEVKCHDSILKLDRSEQIKHAKKALFWFLDHLNLTEVIEERSEPSPWTWWGSMFYAGQLYTTIGYGFPTAQTRGGRLATIVYIMIGIPIFLIILKDVGRLMGRGLRKLYKRMKKSQRHIAQKTPIRRFSMYNKATLTKGDLSSTDCEKQENTALAETKLELAPEKQNKLNEKIHAENSFPISIALGILLLWILFSAALFCIWETEWGYMTSIYFFFVSISTVGLGDIVPSKPDMMIFNFILILVGLALLSMCFNLIQTALERLLDRLLEEYIEEIEKMAEIVTHEGDGREEEAIPFEFKMTGGLLNVPFKNVTEHHGILGEMKGFMAERIANNLIASRLGIGSESDESEGETEEERMESRQIKIMEYLEGSRRSSNYKFLQPMRYQFKHQRPLFKTIQTIERIRPQKGDMRSMVFSKFINSDRLTKLVEETTPPPVQKKMVTISCQTDETPRMRRLCGRKRDSVSTLGTCNSVMSTTPYRDIHFDYSTDVSANTSVYNLKSTLSILQIEDEEPILQSKLIRLRSPTHVKFGKMKRLPRPLRHTPSSPEALSIDGMRNGSVGAINPLKPSPSYPTTDLSRVRDLCGLLPQDFVRYRAQSIDCPSTEESRSHGYRSASSINDSGIDHSQLTEGKKIASEEDFKHPEISGGLILKIDTTV